MRRGVRGALTWIPESDARRGGSRLVSPFADELILGTFVRVGRAPPCACGRSGRGYFFGLERRDVMRSYRVGASFGLEIDCGGGVNDRQRVSVADASGAKR